jgi:hypothetical protein
VRGVAATRLISIPLLLAALLQAIYLQISGFLPTTAVMACATLMLAGFGIKSVISRMQQMRLDAILALSMCGYTFFVSTFYVGESIFDFLIPPLGLILFYVIMSAISAYPNSGVAATRLSPYLVLIVGMVHLVSLLGRGSLQEGIPVGSSALRYGHQDGINLINITGSNVALIALTGYVFARFMKGNVLSRVAALIGSAMLVLPVLASQSRAAALLLIAGVLAAEGMNATAAFRSASARRRLISLFALVGLSILAYTYKLGEPITPLLNSLAERFNNGIASGDPIRAEALNMSIGSGFSFLGAFREGSTLSSGARDNTVSNFILSYGLIGFVIATLLFFVSVWSFGRSLGLSRWYAVLGVTPLLVRSLGEGTYVATSSLFCIALYLSVLAVSLRSRRLNWGIKHLESVDTSANMRAPSFRAASRAG